MNDSPLEITEGDQGFVEASQDYTFKPRPELDNQNLYCVYIQVNGCPHKKGNLYLKLISIRRMVMAESCTKLRLLLS